MQTANGTPVARGSLNPVRPAGERPATSSTVTVGGHALARGVTVVGHRLRSQYPKQCMKNEGPDEGLDLFVVRKECGMLLDGVRVCNACHQSKLRGNSRWKHLRAEHVAGAIAFCEVDANRRRLCDGGGVKEDFNPSSSCLCDRPTCFFATLERWKRLDGRRSCAICLASPRRTHWHLAGAWVGVLTSHFRSEKASVDRFGSSREELATDSDICKRCFMEAYHNKGDIEGASPDRGTGDFRVRGLTAGGMVPEGVPARGDR
ncbi:unnamed protein product [Ectocarpus fasciculatus]